MTDIYSEEPFIIAYYDGAAEASRIEAWQARLQNHLPDLKLVPLMSEAAKQAMAAMVWNPPIGQIKQMPNLKGVVSLGQGVDHIFKDDSLPSHLPVVRIVDHDMSVALGHWVCLSVLEKCRNASDYRALAKRREFRPLPQQDARALKLGVYGVGAIGNEVVRQLRALGFDVTGYARGPHPDLDYPVKYGEAGLSEMLQEMDIHICIMPLTEETTGFFDKAKFSKMKVGAYFINAGRGKHVIEDDLLTAINSGHISGASLDVFEVEPLPDDHKFWDHPHITIWPHVAAQTNPQTASQQIAKALVSFHKGTEPANIVDKKKGY